MFELGTSESFFTGAYVPPFADLLTRKMATPIKITTIKAVHHGKPAFSGHFALMVKFNSDALSPAAFLAVMTYKYVIF